MNLVNQLILATSALHRVKLFQTSGLAFAAMAPEIDEKIVESNEPRQLAILRAEAKALDLGRRNQDAMILGFDQVASLDGQAFGKSHSLQEAKSRLKELQGRTHRLHSAYAGVYANGPAEPGSLVFSGVVDIVMSMRPLSESEMDRYLATKEWQGCAGGYRIEGMGAALFDEVRADTPSIIGLPLCQVLACLRKVGINSFEKTDPPWRLTP